MPSNEDTGPHKHDSYEPADWHEALSHWRDHSAEMFNDRLKSEVRSCVERIHSTTEDWRAAIDGDPAAAVKVALRLQMPDAINVRLDLAMTVLMAAAFDDAGAAAVLAVLVESAPLDLAERTAIATSWRVHKIWCESRIRNRRRRLFRDRPEGAA
ncbi:hypothetical protein [Bradyrhizobium sp. CCBAU 51765]|uniref:hypothetical protein n=1 Tax=Bradyrhizobium sp. CCBAU 51765 TaxID=1325102 RepID=UPI00188907DB|nr:hypothetical protein [Bradyrhizobium sp. CCBAU 51765]QOZ06679.1 hypothetical protein XH96_03450 [Bradyrhizobium sp. CCBAU 51765]